MRTAEDCKSDVFLSIQDDELAFERMFMDWARPNPIRDKVAENEEFTM